MWITNKTIITFNLDDDEYEDVQRFMRSNDMSKWKAYPSTVGTSFVNEQTFFCRKKEEE